MNATQTMVEKFWQLSTYRMNRDGEFTTLATVKKMKKGYRAYFWNCGVRSYKSFTTEQEARWFVESYYAVAG